MPYLLSTQAIADLISRNPGKLREWADEQEPIDVAASVVSVAIIRAELEAQNKPDKAVWLRYLRDFAHQFERDGRLLPVDREVAEKYADIRNVEAPGDEEPIGEDERFVLATALAFGHIWVGTNTPVTQALETHGLQVLDPDAP
jgi:predicted nucleic acid-binding protein